ncbi:MAG: putative virulence factor, partial [Prevotellaceae bacterium]|nr:putative virulence factor [Prevotellaceae bacterium]
MESKIKTQLNVIEKSIKWVKETDSMHGAKGENAYRNLRNYRRKLNKKKFALEGNPAAAMYGESQMGKSYLVGSLLSESGKPFTVIDGQGNSYDFINKINPIGKGAESTSLVTRFSTDYKWINSAFPVKAKLLSPVDLALVLCDSYYNDVKAKVDIALKSDAISEKIAALCSKYESKSTQQTLFSEDDILDIHDYFYSNFSTKATNVIHSEFFNKIPSLIAKTQADEWSEIFALLWNNNEKITKLFSELLKQYAKLDFSSEIYLPVDAVLRDNGTVLDVARLHEIYGKYEGSEPNYKAETAIMIWKNGQEKTINNFSKSYLCALTAELIFRLPNELEASKQFLKNTDLLDFPGARHRLGIHEEDIEDKVIPQMLLRGKVAYLFNKYSYSEKINILLFCHSDRQSAQSVMPEMLNNWLGDMIGKTPEERNAFINNSKVPPL